MQVTQKRTRDTTAYHHDTGDFSQRIHFRLVRFCRHRLLRRRRLRQARRHRRQHVCRIQDLKKVGSVQCRAKRVMKNKGLKNRAILKRMSALDIWSVL